MNTRKPVYHKDNKKFRLVSFPGGLWQLQKHDGEKGYHAGVKGSIRASKDVISACNGDLKKIPHNDPWRAVRRATEWLTAKVQLDTLVPKEIPSAV